MTASQRSRFPLHPLALGALAALSGPAWSQSASAPAAVPAAASAKAPAELETVYVTANLRREKAKDVAGSVSVLNGGQLDRLGVTSIDEVAAYVPSFQVTGDAPGLKRQSIRGITTGSLQIGASVATYIDDQPVSLATSIISGSTITSDIDPLDLERIEVLKGPQGSLYGASALGGLVKYVTVSPNLKQFEGRAELGYVNGRSDTGYSARVAVNVPVSTDLFAIRATAYTRKDPGYVQDTLRGKNDANSFKNDGARLSALLKPSAAFDAKLVLDTQTLQSDDASVPQYDAATLRPRYGDYGAQRVFAQPMRNTYDRAALTMNYDLGFANLLSVTSYMHIQNDVKTDSTDSAKYTDFASVAGFGAAGIPVTSLKPSGGLRSTFTDTKKKVQELRLTSPSGPRFDWLAGIFYQDEETAALATTDFYSGSNLTTPVARYSTGNVGSLLRETAVYANGTYHFSDGFDLQAGVRYAKLSQDYSNATSTYNYLLGKTGALTSSFGSSKESQTTWLLSPRWALGGDDMVYLRAASGYRPGGPNVPDATGFLFPPVRPDSIINYEVGYKSSFPAAKLDLTAALFRIDWKDIQVLSVDTVRRVAFFTNGGKARSQGLELEAAWRPMRGLRLTGTMSAMEAKLTEDVTAVSGLSGDDIPFTPKLSGALTGDYSWALGPGQMSVGASLRYVGSQLANYSHQAASPYIPTLRAPELPSYNLLDLRASYAFDRWSVNLFVKNALDVRTPINYSGYTAIPNLSTGAVAPATVGVTAPRTVGVSLRVDF